MALLKDLFFNKEFIDSLSAAIKKEHRAFETKKFSELVFTADWKKKELKERMHHVADCLCTMLPQNYSAAVKILKAVQVSRIKKGNNNFSDMVFPDYVERYGMDDYDTSIDALELFTQGCSSEYGIRPYIVKYQERTMKQMLHWTRHNNHHVRRLASEGCRPRLPWGMALPEFKKDPAPVIPILEALKNDESDYVRRSVANNLNDISKDHPDIVLEIAKKWYGENENVNAILKHALRTQLKRGHPEALKIFGMKPGSDAKVSSITIEPKTVTIGGNARFGFAVVPKRTEKLRIEYWVHFIKANGSTSKKVFQIFEGECRKGIAKEFSKKHRFQDFTTRKHFPGKHKLSVVLNGVEKVSAFVILKK